jgi:hypothetical protein
VTIPVPIRLVLRNGVVITDALKTVLDFIERDGTYHSYDLAPVRQDDLLTKADIAVGNRIIARMPPPVVAAFASRGPAINLALGLIPPAASLMAPEDEIPWVGIQHLLQAAAGIQGVGLPRATKVLHKKRPALIPILDSVVEQYLRDVEKLPRRGQFVLNGIELIRAYMRELSTNAGALRAVRRELWTRDFKLTECRLLDLFLWAYSGTYTPAWQRPPARAAHPGGGERAESADPHAARGPAPTGQLLSAPLGPDIFIDDEAGYTRWTASHPKGFILNAERTPRPNYLILHQASCRTINGRPSRGARWTGPYIKVCAGDEVVIERWAAMEVGGTPRRCLLCK